MNLTLTEAMHRALYTPRPTIKKVIFVPARWERDKRGRFVSLIRRAYIRRLLDRKNLKTGIEQLAANVSQDNILLKKLRG